MRKLLVVAAHPDDEILGCGATMAKYAETGFIIHTLILGEGITSRDDKVNRKRRKKDLEELKKQIYKANRIVGSSQITVAKFPDNRFDSEPLLDIVKTVEKVIRKVRPSIIFTHYANDLNIDHRITCQAVITATRPMPSNEVEEIYSFEVLSATEWNYPLRFSPNIFCDVTDFIKIKLQAMETYQHELRDFPHPRSLQGIEVNAKYRGMQVGKQYAEAFEVIRLIKP